MRLLLAALLLAGCAAPRPGPQGSPANVGGLTQPYATAPVSGGRPGAPSAGVPTSSTTGPTQRAASRPPATVTPSPEPTRKEVRSVADDGKSPTTAGVRSPGVGRLSGTIAHMGSAPVGPRYAAIPWGPGIRVRICAARCVTVVSSDTGPSLAMQRAGRVADVSVELFVAICGRPASAGLCQGTVSR